MSTSLLTGDSALLVGALLLAWAIYRSVRPVTPPTVVAIPLGTSSTARVDLTRRAAKTLRRPRVDDDCPTTALASPVFLELPDDERGPRRPAAAEPVGRHWSGKPASTYIRAARSTPTV